MASGGEFLAPWICYDDVIVLTAGFAKFPSESDPPHFLPSTEHFL